MNIVIRRAGFRRLRTSNRRDGFSLIEVTISIAITAVALVSIMGMLPAGMKTMREAGDRAVETRIHQQILGEIQLTEWTLRADYDSSNAKISFYDDQGIQIYQNTPDFAFSHVYSARVSVPVVGAGLPQSAGGGSYRGVTVPGGGAADPNLQLVIVEVTSVIDTALDTVGGFDKPEFQNSLRSFQSTITKMDK